MTMPDKRAKQGLRANDAKWTPLVMKAGYVLIPSILLERQRGLGLDPTDINILLHLIRFWWYPERLPYPGKKTIAECMEVSQSTVRRRIADMEKRSILKRRERRSKERGRETNEYDLEGLVKLLVPYAQEVVDSRTKRKEEDAQRRHRKRPL